MACVIRKNRWQQRQVRQCPWIRHWFKHRNSWVQVNTVGLSRWNKRIGRMYSTIAVYSVIWQQRRRLFSVYESGRKHCLGGLWIFYHARHRCIVFPSVTSVISKPVYCATCTNKTITKYCWIIWHNQLDGNFQVNQHSYSLPFRGGSKRGAGGVGSAAPSEISGSHVPPPQKKFKIRPSLPKIFRKPALLSF